MYVYHNSREPNRLDRTKCGENMKPCHTQNVKNILLRRVKMHFKKETILL